MSIEAENHHSEENKESASENQEKTAVGKTEKRMSEFQKEIETLLTEYEKAKIVARESQMLAKKFKDEIIHMMNEKGIDEMIVNGLDSVVVISITYPEREVLDKKTLAEILGVKQSDLSKPEIIVELTKAGKLTSELIKRHTFIEERMQFNVQEYNPEKE